MQIKRKHFLKFYEENADSVFSLFYRNTDDRTKSVELTKSFFMKSWDKAQRGEKLSLIDIQDDSKENREMRGFKYNQYGY